MLRQDGAWNSQGPKSENKLPMAPPTDPVWALLGTDLNLRRQQKASKAGSAEVVRPLTTELGTDLTFSLSRWVSSWPLQPPSQAPLFLCRQIPRQGRLRKMSPCSLLPLSPAPATTPFRKHSLSVTDNLRLVHPECTLGLRPLGLISFSLPGCPFLGSFPWLLFLSSIS